MRSSPTAYQCDACRVCIEDMRRALHSSEPVWLAAVERSAAHLREHDDARKESRRAFWRGVARGMDPRYWPETIRMIVADIRAWWRR